MKIEDIKELVTILEGSSLNYMEVSEGEFHLKLGKSAVSGEAVLGSAAPAGFAPGQAAVSGASGAGHQNNKPC